MARAGGTSEADAAAPERVGEGAATAPAKYDLHRGREQLGLAAEVRVDGALGEAGAGRDLRDGGPDVAAVGELLAGGGDDLLADVGPQRSDTVWWSWSAPFDT